jgi:hypothetical protein
MSIPALSRDSLPKMLATCFSTALSDSTSLLAMPELDLPSAMSPSTFRSREVSDASPGSGLRSSWLITSGSSAVPPAATRSSAETNSATLPTRSLRRYRAGRRR